MEALARLEGVAKSYGDVLALDNLDFEVRKGEVVSVLGPNGAGKTTLVKLLLGLLKPDQGRASVFELVPTARAARVRCGTMLQVSEVPEYLRVREHIELFRSYYPNPLPIDSVIAAAGLEDIASRLSKELSGGQRQRLMFALAICGNPELLFLDEPTVGLDVSSRRAFWKTIREFVHRGCSIVLTTHYLEEADALADRIVVIDRGVQVADGSPEAIKARFSSRRIICRTQLDGQQLAAMSGVTRVDAGQNDRTVILSDHPEQTLRELLVEDLNLSDLEVLGMGLEDAFLQMTAGTDQEKAA